MSSSISKKNSYILVLTYITLFVIITLVIKWSQTNGEYTYNFTAAVIVTEIFKLIVSTTTYFLFANQEEKLMTKVKNLIELKKHHLYYSIPTLIYAIYNNLIFINLQNFNPAIYQIMMNTRIIFTAILSVYLLKRTIVKKQWISVVILFFGCVIAQPLKGAEKNQQENENQNFLYLFFAFLLLPFQAFLSSLGSITNELLFKKDLQESIFIQNFWFYLWGILFNSIFFVFREEGLPNLFQYFSQNGFKSIAVPFMSGLGGLASAFFLKYLSALSKAYATSVELLFVVIFSKIWFKTDISFLFVFAVMMVCFAIILYNSAKSDHVDEKKKNFPKDDFSEFSKLRIDDDDDDYDELKNV
ncbi:nucleotide-sugar transmembrane transporter [Anaeramoeba ignava]|uniref:Nucleotide-sugar transmembrane transporter n=1 Tax=Anaeramoeba ignava TaxID=1746090 RepID=A0A9Q0L7H2_ANAIG|nr:nucleotide-sugar transmembrane transporter [Anaeramoeba ignava]